MRRELREHGFKKRASTFTAEREAAWLFFSVQSSKKSTKAEQIVCVNAGVCSKAVRVAIDGTAEPPRMVDHCHWKERLEGESGQWWTLSSPPRTAQALGEMCSLVRSMVPELERLGTDVALVELWLEGTSPGLTVMQRLLFLSVLLAKEGRYDDWRARVAPQLEPFRGRPRVERVLSDLRLA